MKKYAVILMLCLGTILIAQSVKIGFIQPQRILEQCKIGQSAMEEMNTILREWEQQFERMEREYREKIVEFQEEEEPPLTMTDERKADFRREQEAKKRRILQEIQDMEMEMMRFEQSINGTAEMGGTDGLLMIKQNEILKPVLEQIEAVSTKYAIQNAFSLLLQDNPRNVAAYRDPELNILDVTDDIITEMDKLPKQ